MASEQVSRSILFIDNGGYNLKVFYLPDVKAAPQFLVIPNCIGASAHVGRGITGAHVNQLPQYHGFMVRRPVEKGFIVDGVLQSYLWEYVLQHFKIEDESRVDLWLTVTFAAPKAVINLLHILLTRQFEFHSVTFVSSSFLTLLSYSLKPTTTTGVGEDGAKPKKRKKSDTVPTNEAETTAPGSQAARSVDGTALIVDLGFSATTVVPYIDYLPVYSSIVRLDVGGKLLTNRLKQHISYTQMNMMEDGWLINHVKEVTCEIALRPLEMLDKYARQKSEKKNKTQRKAMANAKQPEDEVKYYLPTIPALMPLGCRGEELQRRLQGSAAATRALEGEQRGDGDTNHEDEEVSESVLQSLTLRQERYLIPELLFCPADVGLAQMGLSQILTTGIFRRGLLQHLIPLRPLLLSRVCLYGGTSNLPNIGERVERDVQTELSGCGDEEESRGEEVAAIVVDADAHSELVEGGFEKEKELQQLSCAELQPLFGALLLFKSDMGAAHRESIERRSRVSLEDNNDLDTFTAAMLRIL